MAWIKATGEFGGRKVKVFVELYSSRRNVYKRVEYYVNGERVTRRKKEIRELVQGAPSILFANTYFWRPFYGNADDRERYAIKLLQPLVDFFKEKGLKVETSFGDGSK